MGNSEIYDLSQLTLIIPTYNRQNYVARQIAYLSNWNVATLIMDGSEKDLSIEMRETLELYPHIQYQNIKESYVSRVSIAASRVKTPYVACLADDDTYLPTGLLEAIDILQKNPTSVTCMGLAAGIDRIYRKTYSFKYGANLKNYTIESNNFVDRVIGGMQNYRPATPYAVYRTEIFRKIWIPRTTISCLEAVEYENAIRTYFYGNQLVTKSVYWLRSFETQPIASQIDGDRSLTFSDWYTSASFKHEVYEYRERIVRLFVEKGELSRSESLNLYQNVITSILENSHATLAEISYTERKYLWLYGKVSGNSISLRLRRSKIWRFGLKPVVMFFLRKKTFLFWKKSDSTEYELLKALEFLSNYRLTNL
jgi:glycosyltransferase domain-containing protein